MTNAAAHQADFIIGHLVAFLRELSSPERSKAGRAESLEIAAQVHREGIRIAGLPR